MVLIIRPVRKVFAKKEGDVFDDQTEGKIAFELDEAEEAEWQDILIYSEYDFKDCHWHHVEGEPRENPDEIYDVLRRPGNHLSLDKNKFRKIFQDIIRNAPIQEDRIDFWFEPRDFVAYCFQDGVCKDWNAPQRAKLCCKNIKNVTLKQLKNIAKAFLLTYIELNEVLQYVASSFAGNSGYRISNIRNIWIIGHTDIRTRKK